MPPARSPLVRALLALLLAAVAVLSVRAALTPPAPVPASAPDTAFSAQRALAHVRVLAQRPHPVGSADHARVRDYVVAELARLGASPTVQRTTAVGTRFPMSGHVENVVARLPGRAASGPAVLLVAHYDGVASGPAAADDGAGTAALLETVRALRAAPPLAHDVIVLVTDAEEQGLLGAAAFVDEHPWARDVAAVVNVEARGTTGRSTMFQTGPGNLDVARVLTGVPGVTATSLATAAYRRLPNDTDLSELDRLVAPGGAPGSGVPALNFAFIGGVTRYHTRLDDVAHLNAGSLQHHGQSMLALARALGDGPLPRPRTGDAVFWNVPLVGTLVVHPIGWALPVAAAGALGALAVAAAAVRGRRHTRSTHARPADATAHADARPATAGGVLLAALGALLATLLAGGVALGVGLAAVALHRRLPWGGDAAWSGTYALAVALGALAVALAVHAFVRRHVAAGAAHAGALLVWALLALLLAARLPDGAYLFTVPLLVAAVAALLPHPVAAAAGWVAAAFAVALVLPVAWQFGAVALGLAGPGAVLLGVCVALLAWLLAPQAEAVAAPRRGGRGRLAAGALLGAALAFGTGAFTVRHDAARPAPSALLYARDADRGATVWAAPDGYRSAWAAGVLGTAARRVTSGADTLAGSAPPSGAAGGRRCGSPPPRRCPSAPPSRPSRATSPPATCAA
jgi:hypothetical protein